MKDYVVKISWYEYDLIKYDYKSFDRDLSESLNKFINQFNIKNEKDKKYNELKFLITPDKWFNSILLTYSYLNNTKLIIFIPEYNKKLSDEELKWILKEKYWYEKKQYEFFIKLINEKKENIELINKSTEHNMLWVLWFGEKDISTYKQIINNHKKKIPIYDIYNLEILKEEYFLEDKINHD